MFPPAGAFVQKISIHALREEGDPTVAAALQAKTEFLSTPSARRATERYGERVMSDKFLSTPSARRATSDGRCPSVPARNFYPRPPRGGRPTATVGETDSYEFLSTPSARRATYSFAICLSSFAYFYPRPPRGGRRSSSQPHNQTADFYPRPPRGGRPASMSFLFLAKYDFYPRPPRGGRRLTGDDISEVTFISIHALREEGDISGASFAKHIF